MAGHPPSSSSIAARRHASDPISSAAGADEPPVDTLAQAVAAAAPALIWSMRLDGDGEWFNPAWAAFTGRSVEALAGDGWQATIHPEDLTRCLGIRAASFAALAPYSLDVRMRRQDGTYRWMLSQNVPRREGGSGSDGSGGTVVGYVGSLVDIDDRIALEEKLAERTQALRLAERRQGQFLATLSHELRNPLAPIANVASVLRTLEPASPASPAMLVRLREILERQVGRLGKLVEELVDATRAAQGQISLVREGASVESVVQAAVARSQARISAGEHRLDVRIADDDLYVKADPARLAQALGNLIDNAAKFSPKRSVITIGVRRVAKTVQISVTDHGHGIDAAFLPHVFELFAQADQSPGRTFGGLGVGLSLARRVAQLHGGDIDAFSEGAGKGAEFILWLPLVDEAASAAVTAGTAGDACRVLIVEDNADALESLRLQVELWGNDVTTARTGDEALVLAASAQPQIVLCDIGLPGMDGLSLARALRETLAGHKVVLAAITGYASDDDQQRARAAGFDAFLVKPLEPGSLLRLLRSAR